MAPSRREDTTVFSNFGTRPDTDMELPSIKGGSSGKGKGSSKGDMDSPFSKGKGMSSGKSGKGGTMSSG
jgi:hypothetical protein